MASWLVSDLHLDIAHPALIGEFLAFLSGLEGEAEALYILGDLFEYWVGDDALQHPSHAVFLPVVAALRLLHDSGVQVYFQHGNRDFLIGEDFASVTGCILLPEEQVVDLYGTPTLLLHGDSLCTDDVEYQRVRSMFRNPQWQQQALAQPLGTRFQQAAALREQSRMSTQGKTESILDVNLQTVVRVMEAHRVARMIHGHTHRPAIHSLLCCAKPATRVVLGDWSPGRISYLRVDADGMSLKF
jgi:UDP-2,3-diacylglucosamine hydrolase